MSFSVGRLRKPEYWIPLLCLLGLLLSGSALLFHGEGHRDVNHPRESLGYLRPLGADIRVMGDAEHTWSNIGREANVFNHDRVFTGEKSEAKVQLKNRQGFTVEPRSLVVISDEDKKSTINLDVGGFLTEMRSGVELLVRYKGHDTKLKSSGAVVRLAANDSGTLHLEVLKGEASVEPTAERPEPQVIKANETLSIAPDQTAELVKYSADLVSPQPAAILWDNGKNVQFKWNTPNGRLLHMEVSDDPEFKHKFALTNELAGEATAKLDPAAAYFWHVVDKNGGNVSNVSSFSLSRLIPPKIETAITDVRLTRDASGGLHQPLVKVGWSDSIGSETFRVETSKDGDFKTVRDANDTQKTEAYIDNIAPGILYWRVVSKAPGRVELTSTVGILRIGIAEPVVEKREPAQVPPTPAESPALTPTATPVPSATPSPTPQPPPPPTPVPTPHPQPVVVVIGPRASPSAAPTPSPSPTVAPVPVACVATPPPGPTPFQRFSALDFTLGGEYVVVNGYEYANGTNAKLLSVLSPGFGARWTQYWSSSFMTSEYGSYRKIQFEQTDTTEALANPNTSQTALGIGAALAVTPNLKFQFDAERAEVLFYHAHVINDLQLDEVPVIHLHPSLEWIFFKASPFSVTARAGLSYWGSGTYGNYQVNSGSGYDFGLRIEQRFKSSSFGCSPGFRDRRQNGTYLREQEQALSVDCGYRLELW